MNQNGDESDPDPLEGMIQAMQSGLREGGPEVDFAVLAAFLDKALPPEEMEQVDKLVHTWRNWNKEYWSLYAASLEDEPDAQEDGRPIPDSVQKYLSRASKNGPEYIRPHSSSEAEAGEDRVDAVNTSGDGTVENDELASTDSLGSEESTANLETGTNWCPDNTRKRKQIELDNSDADHRDCATERRRMRRHITWRTWATAAALLAMVGGATATVVWVQWQAVPDEVLVAATSLKYAVPREPGTPPEAIVPDEKGTYRFETGRTLEVVLNSPRTGYATIIMLGDARVACWPKENEPDPYVQANRPVPYGPLLVASERAAVLVIFTERPAARLIRDVLPERGDRLDPAAVRLKILRALGKNGYAWAAIGELALERQ